MPHTIAAETLVETKIKGDAGRFDMTFIDRSGRHHTLSLTIRLAAELAPVLSALAASLPARGGPQLTRLPERWEVGHGVHEPVVLIRFDDEPAYSLIASEAAKFWQEIRAHTDTVSQIKEPCLH
jgi:hypothetical protein